ncbi:Sterigmatocystin 8-O-methyltransferase [Colletotrichum viniferum]|nr:Sterigmatocystin 8-O-methyltransferase [Colletotrichum viniferum]
MKENDFKVDNGKSAFSRAFQTDLESFDYYYKQDLDRGRRFSLGMTPFTGSYASSLALYPFQDLQPGALIVDVGGGSGHVSSEIAKANPKLKFIVQDLEGPILLGRSTYKDSGLPIEWQIHNAFHPQPVKGADVYFMRRVLHDHSDAIGANILKMICEAMDQKSRILIEDMIAPDLHGEDSEWFINHADIVMMMMHNAKERTLGQWESLIKDADERLSIAKVWRAQGDRKGDCVIIEVKLGP